MRLAVSLLLPLVAAVIVLSLATLSTAVAVGVEVESSGPPLMPTRPMHSPPAAGFTGDETRVSGFPSVQIAPRTPSTQAQERARDDANFDALLRAHRIDERGEPIKQQDPKEPYDASTVDFLERASSTLSSVMQHDARAVFHYKSLVSRAKLALSDKKYDHAATLFKEAAAFYFDNLKAPYAKIASSRALGETIEQRISAQLEAERGSGAGAGIPTANTAAQQFREKELQNQPHVHTAMLEYQLSLKKSGNARAEKKAAKQAAKQQLQQQQATRRR